MVEPGFDAEEELVAQALSPPLIPASRFCEVDLGAGRNKEWESHGCCCRRAFTSSQLLPVVGLAS
jgi:hypothetical protein